MSLSNWRKISFLPLFVVFLLSINNAMARTQPSLLGSDVSNGDSSIVICLDNSQYPTPITFNGDLGTFILAGPSACHATPFLDPQIYTITETLPTGWFAGGSSCRETSGSGLSQWQTMPLSVSIDLAASSVVECTFSSTPNPDEPNDTISQATPTNYGATIIAAIGPHPDVGPDGDVDFYHFQGFAGDTLFIKGDFELGIYPWLYLRDAQGTLIAQATTGYPFFTLKHQLPATGTYFLEMTVPNLDNSFTATYGLYLGLTDPYEPNDSPATAVPINIGDTLRGNMDNDYGGPEGEKDVDYFHFQGLAGDELQIEIDRFNDETILHCAVENAAGTVLASNFGPSCPLEHILAADGDYFIKVFWKFPEISHGEEHRGPYQLTLRYKNTAPVALPDGYVGYAGQSLLVPAPGVLENDTDADDDPLTAVLTSDVQQGDLELSGDGSFTYLPDAGYIGADSFQYYASDGSDQSLPVTVTITIDPQTLILPLILSR